MNNYFLVFVFSISVLFGAAYNTNRHFNFEHSSDSKSYIKMANGDYNVTVTHKYRFAIPLVVNKLSLILNNLGLKSERLQMVLFMIINSVLMAIAAVFIFLILECFGFSFLISVLSVLPFLTSRWAVFASALPLVESFYICSICGFLYALIAKKYKILYLFILLGPIAKESFWFYMPMLFFFIEKPKIMFTLGFTLLSIALFLLVRFEIDYLFPNSNPNGLTNALNHIEMVWFSVSRMFSFKGIGELFFVFGWFNLILLFGIFVTKQRFLLLEKSKIGMFLYVSAITLAQMFLSGDIDRMFFLISPIYCVAFAFYFSAVLVKENDSTLKIK